jgi:hypothetical protein
LSLKAEKNWHQNSGAKRRDVINGVDMAMASIRAVGSGGPRGRTVPGQFRRAVPPRQRVQPGG